VLGALAVGRGVMIVAHSPLLVQADAEAAAARRLNHGAGGHDSGNGFGGPGPLAATGA
jgi:hypothetical protein